MTNPETTPQEFAIVNVGALEKLEGDSFDPAKLLELGVISKLCDGLKILGSGELTRKVSVKAHLFSKSAAEKIQKAGGAVETIEVKVAPVVKKASAVSKKK